MRYSGQVSGQVPKHPERVMRTLAREIVGLELPAVEKLSQS